MGNRCVITTTDCNKIVGNNIGVYLHWNGSIESVECFLKYCKLRGFKSPETDSYGWARLCQVIGNYFGADGLSIGVDICSKLDLNNGDNGVYVIRDWEIVGRFYAPVWELKSNESADKKIKRLKAIDETQPADQRIGEDFFDAVKMNTSSLCVGDRVIMFDPIYGKYETHTVIGFGEDKMVNGTNVSRLPYTDKFHGKGDNINNYITVEECLVVR